MNYIIDIILVLLIALIAFLGSKRGFILTVFDLFSGIASVVIAKLTAPYAADFIYDKIAKETVIAFLEEKYNAVGNAMTDAASSVFGFLPDGIYAFASKTGLLDPSAMAQDVLSKITTVAEIESNIVKPVVTAVINIICFAVIAFAGAVILKIVGKLISDILSKIKIIEKFNALLGGVAGVLKGVIYVFVIAVILCIVSFASETIATYTADSYICSFASQLIGI
ncbi:MAG: CvpA family protein [Clostridia bacterium]|nr:CvpA family protein [Clostridia bacterium]